MPLPANLFADDEELGKKDDDHRPSTRSSVPLPVLRARWKASAPRVRKRRISAFLLALVILYYFFKNMPKGLSPVGNRIDIRAPGRTVNGLPLRPFPVAQPEGPVRDASFSKTSSKPPPRPKEGEDLPEHYYDGDYSFESLMQSLSSSARSMRFMSSKNVLFIAANLKSASILIPFACEMNRWNRNHVHFAYLGRDGVSLHEIQEINGAPNGCDIFWHGKNIIQTLTNTK
jgi:hypothetical protein